MPDPDYKTLCAELTNELQGYKVAHPMHCRALLNRARAALAQPEPEILPKNCWLDDEPDIWPSPCVFEDPEEVIGNCAYASVLHSEGKCKTDCQHYRQPH
jgi:hypothetical protein